MINMKNAVNVAGVFNLSDNDSIVIDNLIEDIIFLIEDGLTISVDIANLTGMLNRSNLVVNVKNGKVIKKLNISKIHFDSIKNIIKSYSEYRDSNFEILFSIARNRAIQELLQM